MNHWPCHRPAQRVHSEMMRRSCSVTPAVLLLSATSAFGQLPLLGFAGGGGGTRDHFYQGTATFQLSPVPFPVLANAPYSGEQIDENVRTLADGSTITGITGYRQKACRDSQGRVRTERSVIPPHPGPNTLKNTPTVVQIQDPVAGYTYIMDDVSRVAHRLKLVSKPAQRKSVLGNLGSQTIDGIEAQGTRQTMVIPAGTRGSVAAVTVTRDEWFSPDLQLTILIVNTDPRQGTTTSKVANLSRIEPDPTLFFVPADYTVVDETGGFTIQWGPK
jgi:hypothetical protein